MPSRLPALRKLSPTLGFCLGLMAFLPAAAEVRVPSDGGVSVGGRLTNELQIKDMAGPGVGGTAVRANTIENTAVRGNLTNRTTIDRLTVHEEGSGAVSRMAVGTISGVTVGGDLENTVTIGTSTNIAIGDGARACTEVGTLGWVNFCR
jgi:hypothetical protein